MPSQEVKMDNHYRRERLLTILQESPDPVSGAMLAKQLNVSRQIIVADVAILRSSGFLIASSVKGYEYPATGKQKGYTRIIACRGKDSDINELLCELNAVVDNGGIIHGINLTSRIYGELQIEMDIHSRRDVRQYLEKVRNSGYPFITVTTGGVHHLDIEAHDEEELDAIEECLDDLGLLDKDTESELVSQL